MTLPAEIIIILDFEKIISDISPETGLKVKEIEALGERERNDYPIYIAEDSALLAQLIHDSLYKAGYVNIDISNNGQACYDKLVALKNQYGDKITDHVKCVITDIEMPLMDGHRLTKLIPFPPGRIRSSLVLLVIPSLKSLTDTI